MTTSLERIPLHRGRSPVAWLGRAVRVRGSERRTVVQTAKATLAAILAWLLATEVLHLPQPFLAPYAAVFLLDATVYRSLWGWVRQVGAVAAGVVFAGLAGQFVPSTTVALGVVVFAGLLLGSWRRFGDAGVWVGVIGMLVVLYGTATNPMLLGDRLLETAMGAAIGAAVNALILPPLSRNRLGDEAARLADAEASLLDATAELVRRDEPPAEVDGWLGLARDVESQVAVAEAAIGRTREERVLNLRRRRDGNPAHVRPLRTLIGLWQPLAHLVTAVRTSSGQREPFGYPWREDRDALADLLACLADAVRTAGHPGSAVDLGPCREQQARLDRALLERPEGPRATLGLGAMAMPARQLLERLEAR